MDENRVKLTVRTIDWHAEFELGSLLTIPHTVPPASKTPAPEEPWSVAPWLQNASKKSLAGIAWIAPRATTCGKACAWLTEITCFPNPASRDQPAIVTGQSGRSSSLTKAKSGLSR